MEKKDDKIKYTDNKRLHGKGSTKFNCKLSDLLIVSEIRAVTLVMFQRLKLGLYLCFDG